MHHNLLHNFVLNFTGTYEEGMEKLVLAEDTSNIDMSSDELRDRIKKEDA